MLTDVETRHGAWYAARATAAADDLRSQTFNNADASARLADLNVVVAFAWAVDRGDAELAGRVAAALASYGIQAGLLRESAARLRRALSMGEMSPGVRSDVLMALVNLRAALGDVADQARDSLEALSLARRAGSDIRVRASPHRARQLHPARVHRAADRGRRDGRAHRLQLGCDGGVEQPR